MTLPSSGPLTLAMIAGEFGGSAPYDFANYYAGGPFVPAGTAGNSGAIPSSGPLSFSQFYGASKVAPFSPVTRSYGSGSGSDQIPTGAKSVTIELIGGGGGGQGGHGTLCTASYGQGGGSGGYVKITRSLTSADWGKSFSYAVGTGGSAGLGNSGAGGNGTATTVSGSGLSFGGVSMTGGPGTGGGAPGGLPGSASGGDVNQGGSNGQPFGDGGQSFTPNTGNINSGSFGYGATAGFQSTHPGQPGGGGEVLFEYT